MKITFIKLLLIREAVLLSLVCIVLIFSTCSLYTGKTPPIPDISAKYLMDESGRDTSSHLLGHLYTPTSLDHVSFPAISDSLIVALKNHQRLLKIRKQNKVQNFDNLELSVSELENTIDLLLELKEDPSRITELEAYQISGEKKSGNVKYTGYYTPLIQVSKKKTKKYKYPIYSKPPGYLGKLPTRKEIDFDGVLADQGFELAYAKNRMDIYYMQVQGSGYVQYRDGSKQMFGYGGSNGHPYRSIGRYMKINEYKISSISEKGIRKFFSIRPDLLETILPVNKSYSFFKPRNTAPKGAGHVPLSNGISMAVDRRYIPLGAIALASIPAYDEENLLIGHELRILLAQDVGGAIKGAGHIDLYMGDANDAMEAASRYFHYGKLWLLLPKNKDDRTPINVSLSNDINI